MQVKVFIFSHPATKWPGHAVASSQNKRQCQCKNRREFGFYPKDILRVASPNPPCCFNRLAQYKYSQFAQHFLISPPPLNTKSTALAQTSTIARTVGQKKKDRVATAPTIESSAALKSYRRQNSMRCRRHRGDITLPHKMRIQRAATNCVLHCRPTIHCSQTLFRYKIGLHWHI
jgi:hypothetical protein